MKSLFAVCSTVYDTSSTYCCK